MRRPGGAAAVLTAVVLALVPAAAASAAPAGHPVRPAKAKKLGTLVICNHTGYVFGVYADGPSIRSDDLAGSFDECSDWKPVKAGDYDIGITVRTPSAQPTDIQARIERKGVTYYTLFNSRQTLDATVAARQETRVDLFVPQG